MLVGTWKVRCRGFAKRAEITLRERKKDDRIIKKSTQTEGIVKKSRNIQVAEQNYWKSKITCYEDTKRKSLAEYQAKVTWKMVTESLW